MARWWRGVELQKLRGLAWVVVLGARRLLGWEGQLGTTRLTY